MTDIVERLRACPGVRNHDPECNCIEAAAEIERLRKTAIETMKEMLRRANEIERLQSRLAQVTAMLVEARADARHALEPKP